MRTLEALKNLDGRERTLSLVAGAVLSLLALRTSPEKTFRRRLLGVAGGAFALRAASGYCPAYGSLGFTSATAREHAKHAVSTPQPVHVGKSITINRPVEDVYKFCADSQSIRLVLRFVERIERLADGYQRWHIRGPRGMQVAYDVEITEDQENSNLLSWRSRATSYVRTQGFVACKKGRTDGETEVHISATYEPPLGMLGHAAARSLTPLAEQMVSQALRHLLQNLEAQKPAPALASVETAKTQEQSVEADFEHHFRQSIDKDGRAIH